MNEQILEKIEPEVVNISEPEEIISLYQEASHQELESVKENASKDIEKARRGEQIIYGLKIGGKLVAMGQLRLVHEKPEYADGKDRAGIHHLRTLEEFRGRGLATKLIQIMEEEAKNRGYKEMSLGVNSNNTNAIKLYEKLGYHEYMREQGGNGYRIGMIKELK